MEPLANHAYLSKPLSRPEIRAIAIINILICVASHSTFCQLILIYYTSHIERMDRTDARTAMARDSQRKSETTESAARAQRDSVSGVCSACIVQDAV